MNRELKNIIENEKKLYMPYVKNRKDFLMAKFMHEESYEIFRWIKELRISEYYAKERDEKGGLLNKVRCLFHGRKMTKYGNALGYFISTGVLGKDVKIFHRGNVIINYRSVIGDGCKLHGDNCIGNNGSTTDCPVLGKNVDVGIGAKIIGGVTIADDIKIGANAVVTKSFLEPGITIAGVPAKKIH